MKTAAHRLRPPLAPDIGHDVDRMLADVLGRLGRLEAQVAGLVEPLQGGDPVAVKLAELQTACVERGLRLSGDGYIKESAAAQLLNRSTNTLRNWRYCEGRLKFRLLGGRIEYALADLAAFLAERGED
jgi:hypothetical protein